MLSEDGAGFTPLPGEKTLYTSPPRTALSLQSLNKNGAETYSVNSGGGVVFLSNRRLIYLPSTPSSSLQSFASPILNLHDTHVTAPWFGPNVWSALVQPVPNGGIPPSHAALELKLTFKEGGAFDFHTAYERLKERLAQAVESAREEAPSTGPEGVDWNRVHLEDLPAYEAPSTASVSATESVPSSPMSPGQRSGSVGFGLEAQARRPSVQSPREETFPTPVEPPPGYEEVQRGSIVEELERRIRSGETEER
ncbi:ubiquinol-cytochrome c reductase complex 17 kd protein [Mytilinidion resinicola]|uniref:Ubiquinol-cytochrome c reductase complex 17 kd protein n=1 Tax=Mytilinidion resinicola TaxID=574789 RepID=A0A6A6YTM7_9PEZI|nr:ubiquinol-cytochrome c reductase complex 17 kd protein [Mytilinidion resinicola]KAF2812306.1 ubiquinol-cytochrome c reductase complex 17 kd protein [Mytilinidion resinicola]